MGPLAGIKVLDLTRVLAGPWCTAHLADMGAEVIKIERPGHGDDSHIFGPHVNGVSSYFMLFNRGKKGITLDFKNPKAVEIFKKMVSEADVVVENFKPGVMDKLGISYDVLKEVNPKIIYASISGFGQYGPAKFTPAYDIIAQAMSGLMDITGFPENPPTKVGSSIGDVVAGIYAAFGITLSLFNREKTGKGQSVDVALLDSVFSLCESNIVRYTMGEGKILPTRLGSRHPISSPFDVYKAKDGFVVIAVANEPIFDKLCVLMGQPELHEHPLFVLDYLREQNADALKVIIEAWLKELTVVDAVDAMVDAGVPASPVSTLPQACADPQIIEREMLVEVEHPVAGKVKIIGQPIKLSDTPAVINTPAPTLGQHNREVLTSFGYSDAEIDKFIEEKVL